MGKITKSLQHKHKETLSPWLKRYVETAATIALPHLPKQLAEFPSRWPFGRGDLYHWIPLLNRFDSILENFCTTYELDVGPQSRDFGNDLLLKYANDPALGGGDKGHNDALSDTSIPANGDTLLIESILKFTRMLLEHCGNRSIYASSGYLNNLLNSTSWSILIAALEVGSELAQRYQASVRRMGTTQRHYSSFLLSNHYNIDLERVQQLALPFVKTPIVSLADPVPATTPASGSKGKEKAPMTMSKSTGSMHANDLVAIASADDDRWAGWGDVKVSYYPQELPPEENPRTDTGRSSIPSTPTPLRRSSTMTSHHQNTPKGRSTAVDDSSPLGPRTPGIADDHSSGQRTFDLPYSLVASASIHDLVSRCPSDMPSSAKYEVFHRLRVVKALTASHGARQLVLAARLLAITNLAYIHHEATFVEKVLRQDVDETRRFQLVYQLAELIHPSTDSKIEVPIWLQTIALALLEAVSNFNARCQDVLSALNANVSHGILLYVIRKAVAGIKDDESADDSEKATELDEWRNNLFSLTLHLSLHTRVGPEMVSAGLMEILVEMLKLRSGAAERLHSMALAFLDGLIWTYQNAFTAFFSANGLDAVADLVVDTVTKGKALMNSGHGTSPDQQSHAVDYKIPYYQQQTLRWLLKFVHHIMSNSYSYSGNTDRLLRNLADKSDLLSSLRQIMEDKQSFGSVDWTNCVTILSDFINNDPTSFAAISESGMVKTYLEAITGRPVVDDSPTEHDQENADDDPDSPDSSTILSSLETDDRPHPPPEHTLQEVQRESLATGILPSPDAINVVPQVLNSISLNNTGMKMVVSSRAFDSFFEIFESPEHVACMRTDGELAPNVGSSFDELARHHPPLRDSISNAVIDMVARIRFLGKEKARTAGWGAKLYLVNSDGNTVSLSEDGSFNEVTESSSKEKTDGDMDVDMADATSLRDPPADKSVEEEDPFTPYIHAVAGFLNSYLSNSSLKGSFKDKGGVEILLDICESPSLAAKFGDDSDAFRVLAQVVQQLVDSSPILVLPSLLNRAQAAIDTLEPIATKTSPMPSHFAPFLAADFTINEGEQVSEVLSNGTKIIKALLNAQTFIKIISDCFPSTRLNALHFYPINVYDHYLNLIKSIGPLLRGVLAEEAGQLTMVPPSWSLRRSSPPPDVLPEGQGIESGLVSTAMPALLGQDPWSEVNIGDLPDSSTRPTEEEQSSPRFQNYEVFHRLLHPMIPTTFPLFQSLGKALLPRREQNSSDPYPKPRQLEIAKALADTVLDHLRPSVAASDPTSKDFHYWIIMLHTLHEMLIDQPGPRHGDRTSVQLILPVLLAFKEEGGFDVLNSMLKVFYRAVRGAIGTGSDASTMSKVAIFGIRKILDLYHVLTNGKHITDAHAFINLQRHMGRTQTVSNVLGQIVVEIRALILPAITELWESSFVEHVPDYTAKRLVETLKLIAMGDNEPSSTPRDKMLFYLLQFNDTRFNWRNVRATVDDLLNSSFDEGLVHEAVFRANGNPALAQDYCRAHTSRIAGQRNPIPPQDADTSALAEAPVPPQQPPPPETSPAPSERASSHGTASSDAMSVDGIPRLENEILPDPEPQSSEAAGASRDIYVDGQQPEGTAPGASKDDSFAAIKERLDQQRAKLREDMIDRCLDVIRTHPDSTIEVSELIHAMVLRQQNADGQEDVCSTLTSALYSLGMDEDEKKQNGKCIASYAHLLALLLQDDGFFQHNLDTLRDKIEEYVEFLKVPQPAVADELPPWIPYILLVLELVLRHDERPVAAQWKGPKSLDDEVSEPIINMPVPIIDDSQRGIILDHVLELLPRVGKEEILATSVLRVLVILTRNRRLAKRIGDKKNLQRLFLMAKQLSGFNIDRFRMNKLSAQIITVLRHVVEDEDVLRQIMRAEIKAEFTNINRGPRGHPDVASYLRHMAALVIRAPDLFAEVSSEMIQFSKWSPGHAEQSRPPGLCLKEEPKPKNDDETPAAPDVKPSTETADKSMPDATKHVQDSKRPVVENPDGVIHFLLCELINYREVEDKEPVAPSKDAAAVDSESTDQETPGPSTLEEPATSSKDKKPAKPIFKSEDHPIFVYRCFLLNCLTELLQSYNRTKVEFINFKRSAPPLPSSTPVKPRSSVLNYLIYDLLCQGNLSGSHENIASKKKAATSNHTMKVLVALVAKTKENPPDRSLPRYAWDNESDLVFVRKFVLDTILKAYERAPGSDEPLEIRYSRMQALAELMNSMIGEKHKEPVPHSRHTDNSQNSSSQAQLRRMMYEKGYLDKLTLSIAEINLNYPGVKRAIKYVLRVLRVLTDTAKDLSHANLLPADSTEENPDEAISSTSSLSDLEDDREETPDLYRNSSLGMLEPRDDEDESDDDDEDGDDLYGDEYDDEMDYDEEGLSEDDQDNISEDSEMGEIEGLPGEPEVVEVIMDEDDDGEEDDSADDEEDDDDDDDLDSADMEDVEDRVDIDGGGHIMDDDGDLEWESDSEGAEEDGLDADPIDYEAEAQDADEAHVHGLGPNAILGNMARALMDGDEYDHELLDDHFLDDGHDDDDDEEDEDEDLDDEEFIYDDDYPPDDQQAPLPALGWDGLNPDGDRNRVIVLDNQNHNRRRLLTRMENRSPFPPGFVVGGAHADPLGEFRSYFSRHHRSTAPPAGTEDGSNPLLRRMEHRGDGQSRQGPATSIPVRLPEALLGMSRHAIDGPMGFISELMDFLPSMGRHGHHNHSFHLHIGGPGVTTRDGSHFVPSRALRSENRRESPGQEPSHAVAGFSAASTMDRYEGEARILFGNNFVSEALKLSNFITAKLTPAAIAAERKRAAEEVERKQRAEEERARREDEERRAREAREVEEKAAKEKREAEEREAAERAALEAAAESDVAEDAGAADGGAMEGVESTQQAATSESRPEAAASSSQPRVMAMLGDREFDVTDLGIDPEYLAALPEEFREEVIAQAISARRSQAREEASTGESPAAFQEFLDALPPQLRREIEQQEAQEQRRRDNGNARPAAAVGSRDLMAGGDMDTATILLTFPPELRDQVLLEQGQDIIDQLPPEMAEQARRLQRDNAPHSVPVHRHTTIAGRAAPQAPAAETKTPRRAVVQMLDKPGVATLVRLMFIAQQGSIRNYLFSVFADVCENRQNRLDVISTILQILQEGSADMSAVERSFSQLSIKARRAKDKERESDQKTPQSLKRTLSGFNAVSTTQTNSETSPLLIVQQCLDLLVDLCTKNPHIPWLFLTEHDNVGSTLKRTLSRKGKTKDSKAHKYAINSLLTLLDRELVMESSVVMTHLADLLNRVTLPLQALERRRKEVEDAKEAEAKKAEASTETQGENQVTEATSGPATEPPAESTAAVEQNVQAGGEGSKGDTNETPQKKLKQMHPPVIPPQYLTLVVRIFVARECSSKTFQNTISTIKNLSTVPGAKTIFGQELVHQARLLSENIVADLDELFPHIEKANSGTEIQGVALSKFSPGASEQNKLLRVLTALDHLFEGKKKQGDSDDAGSESEKQDLVGSLYHNSTFSAMWQKLSTCLTAIHERENMLNVATILLPLIESLMVVCKNTTIQDDPAQSQPSKEVVRSSPPAESSTASLFFSFTEEHRRILNELVRHNPKLMSGTFALLVKNPKVLEFDNKRNYFNRSVHSRSGQHHHGRSSFPPLNLSVRRDQVFHDSFKHLFFKSGDEMKFGKLNIRFNGEEGVDAGGVTREWFQVLARQMFDPNYALFIPVSSDRTTFHPNKLSGVNDEHLSFFKFIGRVIGKALYEGRVLDAYFSRAVYKRILGKSVSVKDMESFDPDYYKSLCWMLENDITDIIVESFSVENDEFGVTNVVDLVPNGRDIAVTEQNKQEYVRLVVQHKLLSSVKDQMEHFLTGFHDIIPASLISIFNEQELELLISGLPDIDVDDWKSNTEYQNYNPSSQQIQWFWRALRSFDKEERAKLLQFVTGTSKVPLNGFKELEGMNGVNRFNIHRDYGAKDRLPTSHTCFNQLDLPEYESYDTLRSQLMKAITAGGEYFGFA